MKKNNKIIISLLILLAMTIGGLSFFTSGEPLLAKDTPTEQTAVKKENVVTEVETPKVKTIGVQALNPDVIWTNWQKNAVVSSGAETNLPAEVNPAYESSFATRVTATLTDTGDTIPYAGSRRQGYSDNNVNFPNLPLPDPRGFIVPETWKFQVNNPSKWLNLPDDVSSEGVFYGPTTIYNHLNDENKEQFGFIDLNFGIHAPFWANAVFGHFRADQGLILYKFDGNIGEAATITTDKIFSKIGNDNGTKSINNHTIRVYQPQIVKAVYKDIDEKGDSTKVIASGEVSGLGGYLDDAVSLESKDITGYEFVNSEYVNDSGASIESKDKKWSGKMTEEKQAVIFWYKKKVPELNLTKTADKKEAEMNDKLTYSLTFENTGNGPLEDAKITDILPTGISKPENITLGGTLIKEGKVNANVQGEYFTWTEASRELVVYTGTLPESSKRELTYVTTVVEGFEGEKKINKATLSGSNSTQTPTAEETVTIKRNIFLYIKQEVMNKHDQLVVPKTGSSRIDNVKVKDTTDVLTILTTVIPSYEGDTNQPFKKLQFESNADYVGYNVTVSIPEFYEYQGYELTTTDENHISSNRKNSVVPLLDYSKTSAYWLTVYIQPTVEKEGPPFYSWDSIINEFGQLNW